MAQFTVYKNKNPNTRKQYPYLVDVQANLLEELHTRVVIPAVKIDALENKTLKHLTPIVTIEDGRYLLLTPQLAGIAQADLDTEVADLSEHRNEIIGALDFLISGI